jgi:anaerobic selenocysteine-containing dehydrogenase
LSNPRYWRQHANWGPDFETRWRQALNDGVIANATTPEINPCPAAAPGQLAEAGEPQGAASTKEYELVFAPDPTLWDGQFANNAWLQEMPKPFSKVTWGNPAVIGPRAAESLKVQDGDWIQIRQGEARLEIPVYI